MLKVGRSGLSAAFIQVVADTLNQHELVKIRMHAPADKRGLAAELAHAGRATLIHLIGHTVILYRRNPDDPKIELPTREA